MVQVPSLVLWFQHTAARRRLRPIRGLCCLYGCFNTQPPEGGCEPGPIGFADKPVSTHSRPKAAAQKRSYPRLKRWGFQHTAARRRLPAAPLRWAAAQTVSTHSRPKAAASSLYPRLPLPTVSTHSRPKAAASERMLLATPRLFQHTAARRRLRSMPAACAAKSKFQHTAARRRLRSPRLGLGPGRSFNTQPPEGGCHGDPLAYYILKEKFQHTAARRRLRWHRHLKRPFGFVSTHSRPKAAAEARVWAWGRGEVSTHSRPKAAAPCPDMSLQANPVSTHSRPKAAAPCLKTL